MLETYICSRCGVRFAANIPESDKIECPDCYERNRKKSHNIGYWRPSPAAVKQAK